MKTKLGIAALIAAVAAPTIVPVAPADAQGYYRTYNGHRHYYRYRCKKSSGTTGLIAGGAGGAVLGSALGGGTAGTLLGGVGGALLGRHLDKKHDAAQNRRNGC
ncbi:opacity protein-like surface antigen [Sphingomonas vulcanisoli]|uniref:Opacity protein-like surface antigen n=1 Tax=Sphingomonas vulcanisoli TaxID=1658060 RepID=A0ABX0TQA5_9SPHN|nr:hypothetical protein [Sphingomonas vulcanisoli]NIJ07718.1 opacity protein-like surface antigen [Sphingomonas vulcanisoli]